MTETVSNPLAALRRFARRAAPPEQCLLCSAPIGSEHQHLLEVKTRALLCSCDACAILFTDERAGRYRRVPTRISALPDFQLSDIEWHSLGVPIGLAFFYQHSGTGQPTAGFPSPGGAIESELPPGCWPELEQANPVLASLQPDVEALLVNRVRQTRNHFIVPIDHCYRLVGLIRANWKGLTGGSQVWAEVQAFFAQLQERSRPRRLTTAAARSAESIHPTQLDSTC